MNDPAGYPELALSNGMPAMHSAIIGSFVWLLGLAVGSFLNVVIYRMPLGISLSQPRWSFCPHCGTTIRWFDNLPVVSWLMLRGRCRFCRTSISVQYPLIEALTALVFVLVWYLLTQLTARADMPDFNIVRDWPYLVAWLVLTACLIAVAAMDIVSYSLDIRITEFAVVAGCVLHSVWARPDFHLPVATSATGAGAAAAFVVMFFLIAVTMWRQNHAEQAPLRDEQDGFHQISEPQPADPPVSRSTSALALIAILALLGCSMLILLAPALDSISDPILPAIPPLALGIVFGVMVLAASLQRHADEEVHAAVEAEAPQARRVALQELRWLLPIILAGMGAYAVVQFVGLAGWESFVRWPPVADRPILAGLVYAMHGTIIGATVGWMLRLVFTLIFGREAFGTGDIYILGATGAIAGWDIALLALSISVGLAMVSWLISQFMKSTLMIPFGPPLALGVLFALWLHQPSSELVRFYVASLTATAREQPRLLVVLGGVMLIGTGAALLAARAVRRAFEPSVQQD